MKRIALAAMLLVALFVTQAGAVNYVSPRVDYEDLRFRTHAAAIVGAESQNHGVDLLGGFVDSSIVTRLGAANMVMCTTTTVSTLKWKNPLNVNAFAVADSNQLYATILFYDSGALSSASSSTADSAYVAMQGSFDGKTWFTLATFLNGTAGTITSRLDQANATGTFFGMLNTNGASGSNPNFVYRYKARVPLTEAKDQTAIWRWPMLRWVVGFSDAVNYSVKARVFFNTTESE